GIDHVVVLVRDLDAAAQGWENLGFTLTPRGVHSAHMGTANHCIMLEGDYIELLGVINPTQHNAPWRAELDKREGLGSVALAAADADLARGELARRNLMPEQPLDFSRPVEVPEGTHEAAFRVVRLPPGTAPGFGLFVCGHKTPHLVWRPQWQSHANGAMAIARLTHVAAEPKAAAEQTARIFGTRPEPDPEGGFRVETGRQPIHFVAPGGLPGPADKATPPYLAAIGLKVTSLEAALAWFRRKNVPHLAAQGRLFVPPASANGVLLEFIPK
ncbi:MAG: VOC family protein, partial [Alphaproteobacteria bacterium]|nr:VOC family protein [Alphaproteobacteria bacterium]